MRRKTSADASFRPCARLRCGAGRRRGVRVCRQAEVHDHAQCGRQPQADDECGPRPVPRHQCEGGPGCEENRHAPGHYCSGRQAEKCARCPRPVANDEQSAVDEHHSDPGRSRAKGAARARSAAAAHAAGQGSPTRSSARNGTCVGARFGARSPVKSSAARRFRCGGLGPCAG